MWESETSKYSAMILVEFQNIWMFLFHCWFLCYGCVQKEDMKDILVLLYGRIVIFSSTIWTRLWFVLYKFFSICQKTDANKAHDCNRFFKINFSFNKFMISILKSESCCFFLIYFLESSQCTLWIVLVLRTCFFSKVFKIHYKKYIL